MLTKEEINQLHSNLRVVRECEVLGKIPFKIISPSIKDELAIAEVFNKEEGAFVEEYFSSEINRVAVERTLVSFNHQEYRGVFANDEDLTKEEAEEKELKLRKKAINKFSNQKIHLISNEYKNLCKDIETYLNSFDKKDLDIMEIEEFIITDLIERSSTFKSEKKDLVISYKILNSNEYNSAIKEVKKLIDSTDKISIMNKNVFQEIQMASKIITGINQKKLQPDFVYHVGAEIIRFILNRAQDLQEQVFEKLSNPKELNDDLKN